MSFFHHPLLRFLRAQGSALPPAPVPVSPAHEVLQPVPGPTVAPQLLPPNPPPGVGPSVGPVPVVCEVLVWNPDQWLGVEGLIWWTKGQPLSVPVLTTGPASQGSSAGNLGVPGTIPIRSPLDYGVAGGVRVFAGNDDVRDTWSPYGTADMLERAMLIGWRAGRVWALIAGGLTLAGVASTIDMAGVVGAGGGEHPIIELLWPAALLLLTAAAWQAPEPALRPRIDSRSKLLAASTGASAALVVLIVERLLDVTAVVTKWLIASGIGLPF